MTLPSREAPPPFPGDDAKKPNMLIRYLSRFDDGEVVRWAFRGMLIGAIGVLALDLRDLVESNGWGFADVATPGQVLPPAVEIGGPAPSTDPRPFVKTDESLLGQPMAFRLEADGVLSAEGSIVPGTAALLTTEMGKIGEYVKTVSLNSPGGALDDAMAMARQIRERGLSTEVADGALCASSCPLVLAGGQHRAAGEKAAIGVHQFYAATTDAARPEQVMADAQATTARISRHLASMDVDPALWLHALDTPPRSLYYFTRDEMTAYRLLTSTRTLAKK